MTELQQSRREALVTMGTLAVAAFEGSATFFAANTPDPSVLIALVKEWVDANVDCVDLDLVDARNARVIPALQRLVGHEASIIISPDFVAQAKAAHPEIEFADLHDIWEEVVTHVAPTS